jgi:hypothetical protein
MFGTQPRKVWWMHVEIIYSMMWLIKPKNITTINTMQITIWGNVPKDSITWWEIKNNIYIQYTLQRPQILDWAVRGCPLHCPDPSLLRATHRLSLGWPGREGRGAGAQGGGVRFLLHLGQAGYISTTHWFLLHSTLNTTAHFPWIGWDC